MDQPTPGGTEGWSWDPAADRSTGANPQPAPQYVDPQYGVPQYQQPAPQYVDPQYGVPQYQQPAPQYADPQYGAPQYQPPPPPASRGGAAALLVVAMLVLVGAIVVAVVLVRGGDEQRANGRDPSPAPASTAAGSGPSTTATMPTASEGPVVTAPAQTSAPATTPRLPTTVADGSSAPWDLIAEAKRDAPTVTSTLKDEWVAQLSSKWIGVRWLGKIWTADDILAEHRQLRSKYGALLLLSSDWGFQREGMWVTVHDEAFSTPEDANAWCDDQGIGPDDCFAKKIHTGAQYSGDTVTR